MSLLVLVILPTKNSVAEKIYIVKKFYLDKGSGKYIS